MGSPVGSQGRMTDFIMMLENQGYTVHSGEMTSEEFEAAKEMAKAQRKKSDQENGELEAQKEAIFRQFPHLRQQSMSQSLPANVSDISKNPHFTAFKSFFGLHTSNQQLEEAFNHHPKDVKMTPKGIEIYSTHSIAAYLEKMPATKKCDLSKSVHLDGTDPLFEQIAKCSLEELKIGDVYLDNSELKRLFQCCKEKKQAGKNFNLEFVDEKGKATPTGKRYKALNEKRVSIKTFKNFLHL